jgi:aryl carrier-like protein
VLGLERVGVTDNFFELGGDSLSLLRVHRRLELKAMRPVDVVDLFAHPTVAALSAFVVGTTSQKAAERPTHRQNAQRRSERNRRVRTEKLTQMHPSNTEPILK